MSPACKPLISAVVLLVALPALAGEDGHVETLSPLFVRASGLFDPRTDGEEGRVRFGAREAGGLRLSPARTGTPDTATLLQGVPGVNVQGAGGVSGLPVIRGLADERLRLQVDDMDLMAACANHMNPALSYIDPARVEAVKVYAGITPVSVGGDSIGGTIQVESAPPEFASAKEPLRRGGRAGASHRSNGQGFDANLAAFLASERLHLGYEGNYARADNYRAGAGFKPVAPGREQGPDIPADEVASSGFRSQNHKLGVAWRHDRHLLQADLGWQSIPFQGFPNQRMDMTENRATLLNLRYVGRFRWGDVRARAWQQRIRHRMDMGADRYSYGTGMPMQTRALTRGVSWQLDWLASADDTVRLGIEMLHYTLHDWWPPVGVSGAMGPDAFLNIDYGRRNRESVFGEWESRWSEHWTLLAGLRHSRVTSDAAGVQGYSDLPTWADDADAFNASARRRRDRHWDLSLMARHEPSAGVRHEIGFARKTRSPSLYQRYPWSTNTMAAGMNNYLGDGNGYLGNIGLEPETAHALSLGTSWQDPGEAARWKFSVTAHVTWIDDFIDAERCPPEQCRSAGNDRNDQFVLLRHVNQQARQHGLELAGERTLALPGGAGTLTLSGSANWLRGKNRRTGDGLYNIMPPNLRLGLRHRIAVGDGGWSTSLEWQGVQAKTRLSQVRNEIRTPGYGLLHLRTRYEWKRFSVDIGIDNLLDKGHALPLGGAYVGQGSSMMLNTVPWGVAVPGPGRSVHAGFNISF